MKYITNKASALCAGVFYVRGQAVRFGETSPTLASNEIHCIVYPIVTFQMPSCPWSGQQFAMGEASCMNPQTGLPNFMGLAGAMQQSNVAHQAAAAAAAAQAHQAQHAAHHGQSAHHAHHGKHSSLVLLLYMQAYVYYEYAAVYFDCLFSVL